VFGLAVDATDVYWVDDSPDNSWDGSLMKCAVGGCGQAPTVVVAGNVAGGGVTVDATRLYWTSWGPSPQENSGSVWTCPVGGCAPTQIASAASWTAVYAVNATTLLGAFVGPTVPDGALWTCSPGACTPAPLASPAGIAAMDTTNAYFTFGSSVLRCPLAGCNNTPTTLVSELDPPPNAVATDGVSVYFTTASMQVSGAVLKCAVGGCDGKPTTIASLPCGSIPGGLAVDATHVYWTDGVAGMVLEAPK
jgi:hypothetical protein